MKVYSKPVNPYQDPMIELSFDEYKEVVSIAEHLKIVESGKWPSTEDIHETLTKILEVGILSLKQEKAYGEKV